MKAPLQLIFPASETARRLTGGLALVALVGISAPILSASPMLADLSVRVDIDGPPPPRHEVVVERNRPGPDYVWAGGYWDGTPGHYKWVDGHWDRPPHGHRVWVAPRWEKDHDGHYHKVRGEWR